MVWSISFRVRLVRVDDMFTGHKCPQNFRALRLLVETVIQSTVEEANDDDYKILRKKTTLY